MFIRAPWIEHAGDGVEVLAEVDGHPVVARERNMLVAAFHPELTDDLRLHALFLAMTGRTARARAERASVRDQRAEALARILVHYSAGVQEGDVCLIQGEIASEPLALGGLRGGPEGRRLPDRRADDGGPGAGVLQARHGRAAGLGLAAPRSGPPRTRMPASG